MPQFDFKDPSKRLQTILFIVLCLLTLQVFWNWLDSVMLHFPVTLRFVQWLTLGLILLHFKQRPPLVVNEIKPSWRVTVLFAMLAVLIGLSWLVSIKTIYWFSMIVLWAVFVWGCIGKYSFYQRLPLLLLSCFLLPQMPVELQDKISQPLQWLSTQMTAISAGVLIPIKAVGNIFYINNEAYEVTVACSGLNSWIVFIFAGLLVFVFQDKRVRDLIHIAWLSPLLALGLNVIRLFITALVAYYQSPDAGMAIHTNLDYILFPLGLFVMFWYLNRLEEINPAVYYEVENKDKGALGKSFTITSIVILLLLNTWVFVFSPHIRTETSDAPNYPSILFVQEDNTIGQWFGEDIPVTEAEAAILYPAHHVRRVYQSNINADIVGYFWLSILETSNVSRLHNVMGSMMASGTNPKVIDTVDIDLHRSDASPIKTLRASVIKSTDRHGEIFLSLLWYQWSSGNAPNRWAWYQDIIAARLFEHTNYNWRLVRITVPAVNEEESLDHLINIARVVY